MWLAKALVACLGLWCLWYQLVLTKAAKRVGTWGPRWLAYWLSKALFSFGSWWLLKFSHNGEEALAKGLFDPGTQYVLPWHPHGSFTVGATYFWSFFNATCYPGGAPRYTVIAPLLFKFPFLSEFLLLCNCREASLKTFDKLLGSGASVHVQPGGLLEQVETEDKQEKVFFPGNLGFVRLAMKHGVPLLPIYAFGENQLFATSKWTRQLNRGCYRRLRMGSVVVHGLGGVPCTPLLPNPLLLPSREKALHGRWGRPVDVGKANDSPSDEQVREVFERYVEELTRMFDEYKGECLPPAVAAKGLHVILRSRTGLEVVRPKPQS